MQCTFVRKVWGLTCSLTGTIWDGSLTTLEEGLKQWISQYPGPRTLLCFICWGIWKCHNFLTGQRKWRRGVVEYIFIGQEPLLVVPTGGWQRH